MAFLLFLLGTVGLTNIIVEGSIFAPVRNWFANWPKVTPLWLWDKLNTKPKTTAVLGWLASKVSKVLHCLQCCGMWVGSIAAVLVPEFITFSDHPFNYWLHPLIAGGATSLLASVLGIFMAYLDAQIIIGLKDK